MAEGGKRLSVFYFKVPRTVSKYALDVPIGLGRSRVRGEFERWRNLSELPMINRRILLGTQELIETHNKWKQKPHVMRYFDSNPWDGLARVYQQPVPGALGEGSTFLRQFLKQAPDY